MAIGGIHGDTIMWLSVKGFTNVKSIDYVTYYRCKCGSNLSVSGITTIKFMEILGKLIFYV